MSGSRSAGGWPPPGPRRQSGWQRQGKPTASAQATNSYKWQKVRREVMDRDDEICQIRLPRCQIRAHAVDKIIPASQRPDLAYEPDNLRAACRRCHATVTAGQAAAARKAKTTGRKPRPHPSQCDPETGEQYR